MHLSKHLGVFIGLSTLIIQGCSLLPRGEQDGAPETSVDINQIPDAVPRAEPLSRYGNPKSYMVNGRHYQVRNNHKGYVERGIASWYGTKFHGRRTSSGEIYDMYKMTAAHRTLPLPTYLQVTNLTNQRSVIVRVNDRGPFHDDRLIDLSYVAAKKLGILRNGTAQVEIRAVEPAEFKTISGKEFAANSSTDFAQSGVSEPTNAGSTTVYFLQVGAFTARENAEKLRTTLLGYAIPSVQIADSLDTEELYRVRVGPFTNREQIKPVESKLFDLGFNDSFVVTD